MSVLICSSAPHRMPTIMPVASIFIRYALLPSQVFYGFIVTVILITAVLLVFRYWRGGVALRATASDQPAAYSMGINVPRVFSLSWTVAAMIADVAGGGGGAIGGVLPAMGLSGLSRLVVGVVGGLDRR